MATRSIATPSQKVQRPKASRSKLLSAAQKKRAQQQVLDETMELAKAKFSSQTREEQCAMTARILAIKTR